MGTTDLAITTKQVRMFALMLVLFTAFLGWLALVRGTSMLVAGTVLTIAWGAAVLFSEVDRRAKARGIMLPLLCLGIGLPVHLQVDPQLVAVVVWSLGGIVAAIAFMATGVGRSLCMGWTDAALPIGWSVSRSLLAIVYYGILTPIGILMRLLGHDPMGRKDRKDAASYWIEHGQAKDPRRYFKQF